LYIVDVNPGDIVILGTDGLFDNLFDEDIVQLVNKEGNLLTPQELAKVIACSAYDRARSQTADTPFARAAYIDGSRWKGGKLDDITVVVARI